MPINLLASVFALVLFMIAMKASMDAFREKKYVKVALIFFGSLAILMLAYYGLEQLAITDSTI